MDLSLKKKKKKKAPRNSQNSWIWTSTNFVVVVIWSSVFVAEILILHKLLLTDEQQGRYFSNKIHITLNGEGRTVSRHCSNASVKSCLVLGKLYFGIGICRQFQDREHMFLNHLKTRCSKNYRNKMQTLRNPDYIVWTRTFMQKKKKKIVSWHRVFCEPFQPLLF